jgi:hypothetical protein
MIRKAYQIRDVDKLTLTEEIQVKINKDYDEIWAIFQEVISTGDTYVFNPETQKEKLKDYWFAPYMHTYVY